MDKNTISNKEKGLSIQQLLYRELKERWQLSYETRMMTSDTSRNQTSTDDTTKVYMDKNTISNKEKGLSIQQLLYRELKERWQLSYETRMMTSDTSRNQTSTDDTTKVDENGVLRDKGRARNSAEQLIYAYGDAIPDATAVIVTAGTERHSALRDYNRPEMLESQQNAMVESYKKLGTVYSESSEKFEARYSSSTNR
ncbi:hypothetical protein DY000_02053088 [Brassica cretica]|uniref:DUF4057 domain-containing protein n=1 Tax=Brassica cretica TaxID=69181 RepID=A0ABQ7AGS5_BRACR|nr:hypothetical protein DY000_02053088 [Brassica cretica]